MTSAPMSLRDQSLSAVKVGDVIFGVAAGGQEKLLLVYQADQYGFSARHVTTQMTFGFDRHGRTTALADGGSVAIVSTAPLPLDLHHVALGLDRKMSRSREYPDTKLSAAEIRLILTCAEHFKASPLPHE